MKHASLHTAFTWMCMGIAFAFLAFYARDTVHWRDSAEFVLAASYLDIPHPPGFASYGAFGNLFTLIPLGPLTWRVHLFSVFTVCTSIFFLYDMGRMLQAGKNRYFALGLTVSCLPLFLSPAFLRQATTAEAYQFNALFIILVLWCGLRFVQGKDFRYLYLGGFISGLGLGNHPAFLLFAFPGFLLFIPKLGLKKSSIALLFSCLGILILAYLPVRASANPPLNTGEAVTVQRTFNLLTDARDRHLRPKAVTTIGHLNSSDLEHHIKVTQEDAEKILKETGWYMAPMGFLGLLILLVNGAPLFSVLSFFAIGSTLFFFRGWQPDPMVPAFLVLALLASISFTKVFQTTPKALSLLICILLGGLTIFQSNTNLKELRAQHFHDLAESSGEELLTSLPYGSAFITESSWYIARYLQAINGVREDLVLSYSPQFLFPEYFKRPHILIEDSPWDYSKSLQAPKLEPNLKLFGSFLSKASRITSVFLEPATVFTPMLLKAASITPEGLLALQEPTPVTTFPKELLLMGKLVQELPPSYLRRDASSYLETRAIPVSNFLVAQSGNYQLGISGLEELCGPPKEMICSDATFLTMAQYALQDGKPMQAETIVNRLADARGASLLTEEFRREMSNLRGKDQ